MSEQILPAFNGQLDLRRAYGYSRAEVFNFLNDVTQNPTNYGVRKGEEDGLSAIKDEIISLSLPEGAEYRKPLHDPDQHILRRLNENWISPDESKQISKFYVCKYSHDGLSWWSPVDLLGLFLSKLALQETPRKEAFISHSQLCLASGVEDYRDSRFFLGSCLTGYIWGDAVGEWQLACQKARYDLLDREVMSLHGWSFADSPFIAKVKENDEYTRSKSIRRFGNCAETYPWIKLLKGQDYDKERIYGLALCGRFHRAQAYDDRPSGHIWKALYDPCENCAELLRIFGGKPENFAKMFGSEGAPE